MSTQNDQSRLKKGANEETRTNREAGDRPATQSREFSDSQRLDMFRQQFHQSSLPDLPKIPGHHTCWLTTTNPRDTIQGRVRLGYTPIKPEEVPGWEHASLKTGEYAGCIGVNEMIAFKIQNHLYQRYMTEAHHNQPLAEEQQLRTSLDNLRQDAASRGYAGIIAADEGFDRLGRAPRAPSFLDDDNRQPLNAPLIPQVDDSDFVSD